MNIQQALKQAQALQAKMAEMQNRLADEIVEGKSGGGMVVVKCSCKGVAKDIQIDESLLKPEEKEILQDLIIAALNNAKESADVKMSEEMKAIQGSLGLPPGLMNNFPF
jgi:DNA-binding YbaB/EbfC family protein